MTAKLYRQLANLERDHAAEIAAPMVQYAQRSLDRDIAFREAANARLRDSIAMARS